MEFWKTDFKNKTMLEQINFQTSKSKAHKREQRNKAKQIGKWSILIELKYIPTRETRNGIFLPD